jgi:protein gp37
MGYPTPIEWTDATWNPIGGCSIKSPGCSPCYAQKLAGTWLKNHPLYGGTTNTVKGKPVFNSHLTIAADGHQTWKWPIGWRGAKEPKLGPGMPSLIFVGDMSDLFHEDRPRFDQDKTLASIIYSRHIGQLLTKRPDVMCEYFLDLHNSGRWFTFPHPLFGKPNFAPEATSRNVLIQRLWLGMSAERQREFDERWLYLRTLARSGYTIFISYEPAIGPLVLPDDLLELGSRVQVIAGGMSGDEATPAHPDWFRAVRDQCQAAGVAFLFKQWGEYEPQELIEDGIDVDTPWRASPCGFVSWGLDELRVPKADWPKVTFIRVGKKAAGRLLDGCEHNGFPAIGQKKDAAAVGKATALGA